MRGWWLIAAAALALLSACNRPEPPAPRAGDIVLITIDTWRADAAGFAGNAGVKTPFLDAIAARGLVFTNAHAHNVVTLPSHANILTGLNPYQHGVRENAGFVLDGQQVTIAEMLKERGFATGAFVGALPLDARYGLNQGFDVYDDNYGKGSNAADFRMAERPADGVLGAATTWWRSMAGRRRFLWIHLYDPHAPYANGGYLGEVAAVDRALSALVGPQLDPKTLLVVTSDHGEALGDHGEATHGLFAYESTLKVPLLIAGEGIAHRTDNAFVRHIDIVPTILDWLGEPARPALPGTSLLGEVADRDTYFESLSAALNRGWAPLAGVIRNRAKYIDLPIAELYDLPSDPAEGVNLVDARRRDVVAARTFLESVKTDVARNTNISPDEAARLRSLGYLSGSAEAKASYTAEDDPKNLIALDGKMHAVIEAYELGNLPRALALAKEVVAARPDMIAGRELLAVALQRSERVPEALEQLRFATASGKALASTKTTLALLLTETGRAAEAIEILAPIAPAGDPDVLNAYGVALADRGDPAAATTQFERVLAADPNNAPAHQNLGIVALRRGDAVAARSHLDRALALNPALPLALNTYGVLSAQQGDLPRAVDFWRRAVAIDPRQYDALYNIAVTETRAGHVPQARAALEQFIRTAPAQRYSREIAAARATQKQATQRYGNTRGAYRRWPYEKHPTTSATPISATCHVIPERHT